MTIKSVKGSSPKSTNSKVLPFLKAAVKTISIGQQNRAATDANLNQGDIFSVLCANMTAAQLGFGEESATSIDKNRENQLLLEMMLR